MRPKPRKNALAERLLGNGCEEDAVVNNILALMVGATVELSQCMLFRAILHCSLADASQ
jgi:hypothetical protein